MMASSGPPAHLTAAIGATWELRGAVSLARLRRQQGRPQEAVALLAPILGWFTEGFDTADLKEAKTLLDKLTEPAIAAEG
jgi:predicted ATPase